MKIKTSRISLKTIFDTLRAEGVEQARKTLSGAVGAVVQISGKVEKHIKRGGACRLFIQLTEGKQKVNVFADCAGQADTIKQRKIRKGSAVSLAGKFRTFGHSAVCLTDCKLTEA